MRGRAVDIQKVPGPMGGKVRKSAKMDSRVLRESPKHTSKDARKERSDADPIQLMS